MRTVASSLESKKMDHTLLLSCTESQLCGWGKGVYTKVARREPTGAYQRTYTHLGIALTLKQSIARRSTGEKRVPSLVVPAIEIRILEYFQWRPRSELSVLCAVI
jgi:hypothetical protein